MAQMIKQRALESRARNVESEADRANNSLLAACKKIGDTERTELKLRLDRKAKAGDYVGSTAYQKAMGEESSL